jgi:hypothetical protein
MSSSRRKSPLARSPLPAPKIRSWRSRSMLLSAVGALVSFGSEDDGGLQEQLRSVTDEACIPGEQRRARIDPSNTEQEPWIRTGTTCLD